MSVDGATRDAINAAADPGRSFDEWRQALMALKVAESRGEPYAALLSRSEDVIRARSVLTHERVQAGLRVPDDVLEHLTVDELLLGQPDDRVR
ncbi:MAG TPA: hypothetical protein VIJ96_11995 [Acidothermaceae bacterium]